MADITATVRIPHPLLFKLVATLACWLSWPLPLERRLSFCYRILDLCRIGLVVSGKRMKWSSD